MRIRRWPATVIERLPFAVLVSRELGDVAALVEGGGGVRLARDREGRCPSRDRTFSGLLRKRF